MVNLSSATGAKTLVRPDHPDHVDALMFLIQEAELLDANDLEAWLDLLAPEVTYTVPVRTSRLRQDPASEPPGSFHAKEDRTTLELRVKRLLESDSAWVANPEPRFRRFVSNVRVRRADSGELCVSSYQLLLRSRHDLDTFDLVSAERHDVLGRTGEGDLELVSREIVIDQTRLGVANLPIPL